MKDIRLLGDILKHKLADYRIPVRTYLVFENILVLILLAKFTFQIPYFEVAGSFQPLGVTLIGAIYGYQASLRSIIIYFLLGVFGAPVFEGSESGIQHLFDIQLVGYYSSFIPAVLISASLATFNWDRKWLHSTAMILLSVLVIFLMGVGIPYAIRLEEGFFYAVYDNIPVIALQVIMGTLILQLSWLLVYEAYPELKED
ncbi:MAG: biotin transporter BioY [Bacteroidia bacterium]|jgi:biotin transporter BioY